MNLYNYIDNYGIYSFEEEEFNEIDAAIFSYLSYANLTSILGKKALPIKLVGRKHYSLYKNDNLEVIAVKEANNLLNYLKDTKRYQDCLLTKYYYEGNSKYQFGVLAIEFQKNKVFISYEGTNELISGWKENFLISVDFPTITHKEAINFLNKHYTFSTKKLIIGGHSKGGNLAMVASAYANPLVKRKIEKIYSFDGPGLKENEFNSKKFQSILSKYNHFIPEYSVFGLILNNTYDFCIKASTKTILSHNVPTWEVVETKFKRGKLSLFSKELKTHITKFLDNCTQKEMYDFIENLDLICEKAKISSLLDIKKESTKILKILNESKNLSENTKNILTEFIEIIIKSLSYSANEDIKNFINNIVIKAKQEIKKKINYNETK